MYTLWIIFAIVVFAALWFVAAYNILVRLKALVSEGWSGVEVQLKRRYDLIPNLVATVKGYSTHEKDVFEKVTQMRAQTTSAHTMEERAAAEAGLTSTLKTLFAVAESYPELKANQNFLSLQSELSTIETEINLARRYYNGAARNYNTAIAVFPRSIVASITGFKAVEYFALESKEEGQAPKVQF